MRAAVALIGAKVEAVLLLPQVVGAVDIAQQRQLVAHLLRPGLKLGDGVEQHVLVAHHHHRHVAAEPFADLAGVIARRVHHDFAADLALGGLDHPFAALAPHAGRRAEPLDPRAHLPRALGQRLRQLRRVDVAVIGIIQARRSDHAFPGTDRRDLISSGARIFRSIP